MNRYRSVKSSNSIFLFSKSSKNNAKTIELDIELDRKGIAYRQENNALF